MTLALSLI